MREGKRQGRVILEKGVKKIFFGKKVREGEPRSKSCLKVNPRKEGEGRRLIWE